VAVGSPDGPVSALAVHNGKLILGGSFSQIDGTTYNHIAAYNGSAFEALDNGVPTNVKAIETYDGKLFAGCQLLSAGQQDTFALGYYDGSQWTRVIGDPWHFQAQTNLHQISINALKATPYGLFAGGNFFYPNFGTYGRNLLRYDNGTIQGFGILDSTVNSLAYLGGELFVGGDFTHAFGPGGMMPLNHITYINVAAVFSTDEQVNLQTNLFPNPARNYAELSFENPVDVKDIQLTGITGQTIRMPYTEEGNGRYRLDVSGLASGAHILSVYTDAGILERKLVIAR
ncbi:MAG: T9SS type A sorting domain-containing protein, partial [Owenweeksia sp.]